MYTKETENGTEIRPILEERRKGGCNEKVVEGGMKTPREGGNNSSYSRVGGKRENKRRSFKRHYAFPQGKRESGKRGRKHGSIVRRNFNGND